VKHPANPSELRSLARAQVALERTITKWRRRWPIGTACLFCGVTNPIALGGARSQPTCYADKVRRTFEEHSLVGGHRPPRVITEANAHKVQDEAMRIVERALLPGASRRFAVGLAAWVATCLTGLGTLEPGP
jgi:hypothetical protein